MEQTVQYQPIDLRIDAGRWIEPMVTGNPKPVFSWAVQNHGRNQFQKACRVQVAAERQLLWDSGWRNQKEQSVVYDGPDLESAASYTLTVTVEDNEGIQSQSAQGRFYTALLEPWPAPWIAPEEDFDTAAIYFRNQFHLKEKPVSAMLFACGIGYQQIHLNGTQLDGDRFLAPSFSAYHKCCYYTAQVELQEQLCPGENHLDITVAPGWRRNEGAYLEAIHGRQIPFVGIPQLTAVLQMTFTDGSIRRIVTDEHWRCGRGPITDTHLFHGEHYDARLPICTGRQCRLVPSPGGVMRLDDLEPIRCGSPYPAVSVTDVGAGAYIFDFGQNLAGICRMHLPAGIPEGTAITLRHAERLDQDGRLYTAPLRTARAADSYIVGSNQEQVWQPAFTYHGFRYVEVTGLPVVPEPDFLTALPLYNGVDNRSRFVCGSPFINQLHAAIVKTEQANLHSVATDCPQRDERMGWLNDATVRFEELPFNFETGRLLPKIIRDIIHEQADDGAIPCTAPYIYGTRPTDPVCSSFIVAAKQAYLHQGNVELIREVYPALCRWNQCLAAMAKDHIVWNTLYGDWASPEDCCMKEGPFSALTPGAVLSTGYYYYNARALAEFAEILGLPEDAKNHAEQAAQIQEAFLDQWLRPDGTVDTGSQGCQAFALWVGIIPKAAQAMVARKLHEAVDAAGYRLTTGNLCTLYLMEALTAHGYVDDAWQIVTRDAYPSWGYMFQNGATTIWERFEYKLDPAMNSHCHPMYGAVGAWFYTHLAGITPMDRGFSQIRIQPYMPDALQYVEAVVDTCKGAVVVKWHKELERTMLFVTIPFGTTAQLHLPDGVRSLGSGFHSVAFTA